MVPKDVGFVIGPGQVPCVTTSTAPLGNDLSMFHIEAGGEGATALGVGWYV
jgi:hypothetical protein